MSGIRPSKWLQKNPQIMIFAVVERALISCFTVASYGYFLEGN